MIRFTSFLTYTAAFVLAVPTAVSVATPVTASQFTRPPSATMSTLVARGKITARLSETSFPASRVGSVKLTYSFSKPSRHFGYRLSFKKGSRWQTVNRVKKTGRFKGSRTVRVKKLFAGKPVKVGRYRLKLTADGGSTTLAFTVTGVPPVTPPVVVGYTFDTGVVEIKRNGTDYWSTAQAQGSFCGSQPLGQPWRIRGTHVQYVLGDTLIDTNPADGMVTFDAAGKLITRGVGVPWYVNNIELLLSEDPPKASVSLWNGQFVNMKTVVVPLAPDATCRP